MRICSLACLLLVGCISTSANEHGPVKGAPFPIAMEPADGISARRITNADLLALRDIGVTYQVGGLSLSPDKSKIAFQLRSAKAKTNSYDLHWYVASTDVGAAPLYVGDGGDPILYGKLTTGRTPGAIEIAEAQWSPDGLWIAYRKKTDNGIQIWRALSDGSREEQLTHNAADVVSFHFSKDGTKIHFDVSPTTRLGYQNALQREGEQGYYYDERFLAAVSRKPLLKKSISSVFGDSETPSVSYIYELTSGVETTNKSDTGQLVRDNRVVLEKILEDGASRDLRNIVHRGDRFAWLENVDHEKNKGPSPPLTVGRRQAGANGELCDLAECNGFITNVWLDEETDTIYFRRRYGVNFASVGLYAWEADNKVRAILENDNWVGDCEITFAALVCLYESWTHPRRIVRIDPASGAIETLADPNPEFRNIQLSKVEKLEWRGQDGAEAVGHLVYPIDYVPGRRYPLVFVQYRSRGFLRGGIGDEYPIHVLAANGFAVVSFDRPDRWDISATEGDAFERNRHDWGEDLWERESALTAIETISDELVERGIVDAARVGITGLSDGAETVWYSMMYSDHFAVAAASGGGWSPTIYYLVPADLRRNFYNMSAKLQAPGNDTDERWRRISPEFHVDTMDTPILIQAADSELLEAVPMHEALKDAGKPVEMRVFPGEYHVKFEPKHRAAVYERNVDWFNFWLRDVEDSNPEKLMQYERWRKLREQRDAGKVKVDAARKTSGK